MKNHVLKIAIATALTCPLSAFATNGMSLEGYGSIARGMGGASTALNTGLAAMMQNPATMSMALEDGQQTIEACLSFLGPDVSAGGVSSGGDAYWMPALGWGMRKDRLTYGVGAFAQGGMGTEYGQDPMRLPGSVRSELGVGRVIAPLAFEVNNEVTLGASIDFLWAGLDLQMNMPGQMLGMMMDPSIPRNQNVGSANGSMVQGLMQAVQGGMMGMPSYARFDFSNSDDFTGEAMGTGFAGKVGMLYKHNEKLKFGLTYHFESQLNDLESDNATVSMNMDVPGLGNTDMAIPGKITLNDFQWPAMLSAGMSMVFTDRLTAAVDIRRIYWSQVMKDFAMTFTADQNLPGMLANFSGSQMDTTLYQDWDDQNVFAIGAAYKVTPDFTVRAGLSLSDNPIPDARVNYLFPAITQDHYSIGAGYNFAKNHNINFAFIYAPEVKQTNPGLSPLPNDDMLITHSQINWCLGYSYKF